MDDKYFKIKKTNYPRLPTIDALSRVVSTGILELTLVSGYTGTGKSSLVQELQKPITSYDGFFISGKFDQYKRDIPHATIIQAFKKLVRQLLTEKEEKLNQWRQKLHTSLGRNARVLIDVIPELRLILGDLPPVPELSPTASQNRFNWVFQDFIQAMCKEGKPLVLFFDDMQWADGATLKLIESVLAAPDIKNFYLVLAYRDNEVEPSHPFSMMLERISIDGPKINKIVLHPLNVHDVSLVSVN